MLKYMLHELKVHQLELEVQNEELRRAQRELEASRMRCYDLYDQAPIGYLTLNEQGQILEANLTAAAMLVVERSSLIEQSFFRYILPVDQDIFYLTCKQLAKSGNPQSSEFRMLQMDGKPFWVKMQAVAAHDKENRSTMIRMVVSDINERKQAEEALQNARDELEQRVVERTSALAEANEQMKKVSFELVWAEERERERIAGELHDQVGQSLLLAKMKLDQLADGIVSDTLRTSAEEACLLLENSIKDIRSLTFKMRPPILDTAGIQTSLEWLCTSICSDYALQIEYVDAGQPVNLPAEMRYSLYQAVRELLLNIVKHARTEKAQLSLESDSNLLVVKVVDSGVGFNLPDAIVKHVKQGGYGLYNVKQRIEQMGGRFAVESEPGMGTAVTLSVPLTEDVQSGGVYANNNPARR
jgi:PAS domain S-box-containing protein